MKSIEEEPHQTTMVEQWLAELMASYNKDSMAQKRQYAAQVHVDGMTLQEIVWWHSNLCQTKYWLEWM